MLILLVKLNNRYLNSFIPVQNCKFKTSLIYLQSLHILQVIYHLGAVSVIRWQNNGVNLPKLRLLSTDCFKFCI